MNVKLIVVALAAIGLTACGPDITPQTSTTPSAPVATDSPAQPATEQQVAQADKPADAPSAQEDKKEDTAAPAADAKQDEAAKQGEGEKKAD